ncbi:hypothetical protein HaLaN_31946, partial [Haematococcus lacustris]
LPRVNRDRPDDTKGLRGARPYSTPPFLGICIDARLMGPPSVQMHVHGPKDMRHLYLRLILYRFYKRTSVQMLVMSTSNGSSSVATTVDLQRLAQQQEAV